MDVGEPSSPAYAALGYSAGLGQDPVALSRNADIDEQEAIAACQEEWLASTRRHVKRKERQEMASRLLSVGDKPGHDFFRLLAQKLEEYQVPMPTVQIEYKNLTVKTQAMVGSAGIPTAGNFGPQLLKAAFGIGKGAHTQELTILDGLNGVLKPGRCTLLLGPPGSGKTTFLRVLGNRLRGCNRLQVSGSILYNGHNKDEFVVERTTAFVDQHDNHIPNLSVAETVKFAHVCQRGYREPEFNLSGELCRAKVMSVAGSMQQLAAQPGQASLPPRGFSPSVSRRQTSNMGDELDNCMVMDEIEQLITEVWGTGVKTEVVMRLLGLGHCRDTMVGDGGLMMRGISGGERKRLTTAEMVVGPQRVLLMDEISTGLDSATLFSVISFFTAMSHALNLTTIISLLQPPPEVFNMFDDLLLLANGKMLYHGPLQHALRHFTQMGFQCPVRKDLPSFLLEITTPAGQLEFASKQLVAAVQANTGSMAGPSGMLLSLDQMASTFWSESSAGNAMVQQLSEPFDPLMSHPAALEKRRYALSPLQAIAVCTRRQAKLVLRDKVLLKGRMLQIIAVSLMVGSLFFRLSHGVSDARSFYGAAFMVILFMSMGSMPQIGMVMAQKGVSLKHRDSLLYPGYAHGAAMALSQLPVSVVEATLFSCIIYFMVGFHMKVNYFFIFWVVVVASNLCLTALFRLLAVLAPNPTLGAAYGGLALLILILTSGFAIVRGSIPLYWIWAYYLSPFAYALRALVINEFRSPQWSQKVLGVPGAYTMGQAALISFDFYTDENWIVIGIAFLFGAYIILSAATCLALDWVTGPQKVAHVPDAKQLELVREAAEQRRAEAQLQLLRRHQEAAAKATGMSRLSKATRRNSHAAGTSTNGSNTTASSLSGSPRHYNGGAAAGDNGSTYSRGSHEGGWRASLAGATNSFSSGLHLVKSAFRPSDPGEVFSPRAVRINMDGGLDFTPITLVFQELRYFVPNPSYKKGGWGLLGRSNSSHNSSIDPGFARDAALGPVTPSKVTLSARKQRFSRDAEAGRAWSGAGDRAAVLGAAADVAALPPPKELELLKGVSGHAVPGKLMALMGGSGAGKTTLMDVICGRKTVGRTTGHLLVNGQPIVKSSWSRVVGYVEQMDVHTPAQTVIEALWFSGRLRLSPKVSDQQVRAYVEQVIDIVDLTDLSFSLVGLPGGAGGLSTEQLKRLTIAVELVANPSVVFMDEPTSGLDARAAAIVMRAVRNVALSGRTVMVTIHQPSIEIFEAFDTLLLLQRGGRTTYFGPLGDESSQLISYLQCVPGTCPIAAGQNPATWMLEVTGGSMAMVSQPNSIDWPGVYAASSLAASNAVECERLVQEGLASGMQLKMTSMYAQPFNIQVRELLLKYWLVYWRTPSYTLARCFLTLCVAFIYGSMYFKAGHLPKPYAAMGNVQNIMGIMFSSTNFLGMTNLMAVMPLVGMERVVFYRERGALPYDPFAYGVAIALVEIPYLLIQALLFVPVIYSMIGFQAQAEKCFFYFMMFLASISFYTIFGQFMVYVTPSQQIAQVVGAGLNFMFNLFNGFVIAYPAMPSYWRWLNRLVPTTWVLYGLGVSQLGDVTNQLVQFAGRRMPVSSFTKMLFDFDYDMRWWCLAIVFGYVVFFRVTSILALKYMNFLKR
ncbi:hypothetical protein OEZ86_009302 [Tetradesmus obliquus]|nr:hypothetical protein OEZ86_009302 [Tetradesmus obliquus]